MGPGGGWTAASRRANRCKPTPNLAAMILVDAQRITMSRPGRALFADLSVTVVER